MNSTKRSSVSVLVCSVMCAGCASAKFPQSGFLTDYAGFLPHPTRSHAFIAEDQSVRISDYSAFVVDPVVIYFDSAAEHGSVDPVELKKLTDAFYQELVAVVEDERALASAPGPGVARLRVAITNAIPREIYSNTRPIDVETKDQSGVTMEAELIDTESGRRIFAIVDTQRGQRDIHWSRWGNAEGALKQWAVLLRQKLRIAPDDR